MPLSPATRLGPYEIVAAIGAGGMGEVYRAKDTRLDRTVAIKVLPEHLSGNPQSRDRFDREAKAISSLSHPHICQLYDVGHQNGIDFLVMEYLEGETLAHRIKKGPLPADQVLQIAIQMADALEMAHRHGVIHRDLKPGNIMLTKSGAKLLDFGLAKMRATESVAGMTALPTQTTPLTGEGTILGTVQYMAPEQLEGAEADARTDIFALGAVLFEMATGRKAFEGKTQASLIAAIMSAEPPPISNVQAMIPPALNHVVRTCLAKEPDARWQTAHDVLVELKWIAEAGSQAEVATLVATRRESREWLAWTLVAVFSLTAAALAAIHFREKPPAAELMRFQIPPPEKVTLGRQLTISPDGHRLAFTARGADGVPQIWVRSLETLEARPLPGTEGGPDGLFWSPDSRFIGFGITGKLKRVEVSGGPVQSVCDLPADFLGAAWAPDGTIVFGALFLPLMRVADTGGVPAPITVLDPSRQEAYHGAPSFLPDGRHFLYARGSFENGGIYLGSLDEKPERQDSKRLVTTPFPLPVYARSPDPAFGYVLFQREGSLMALRFDVRRLQPAGVAVPIAESIISSAPTFTASANGVLAFRTGSPGGTRSQLLWFDRQGKKLGQIGPPADYSDVQLSPDGKLLLVDQRVQHLWFTDPARGVFSRVNPGDTQDYAGLAVSPDGRVAFTYTLGGALGDIYVKLARGAGAPEPLVKSATMKHPNHWSLDGRFLIYDDHTAQKQDLWIVPMAGDRKPIPFLVTPADETFGQFSPDTKWIAYSSDESGRREVYVQGFVPDHVPAAGIGKWQISNAGGDQPRWRRDGKELYYIALTGKMMAVPVKSTATTFEPGVPIPLFDTHARGFAPYDVAPGGRFLLNTIIEDASANTSPITVVLNWTAGLKK
jgi:hypothetical protein